MHRLYKRHSSKGGFSLLEVLIVVAIIVILAGVVGVGVAGLIRTANRSNDAVKESSDPSARRHRSHYSNQKY